MSTSSGETTVAGVKTRFSLTPYDNEYWEFEWTLTGLLKSRKRCLQSHPFWVGRHQWMLKIFPRGEHKWKDRRFISLSCRLLQGPPREINVVFSAVSNKDTISVGNDVAGMIAAGGSASCPKFLHHRVLLDPEDIFYKDGKLRVVVAMRLRNPTTIVPRTPLTDAVESMHCGDAWSNEECVVCLSRPRTSGFLHMGEAHICVCEPCARKMSTTRVLCCPICRKKVDRVIYKIF